MKLLSLFSGIGAFEKALDKLGIPYELVAFCEIDKYAAKSYQAIHGVPESMNLGDITKVDEKQLPKDIDLITYGFPCQDISIAGNQKGLFNADGSQTRSGLFFEALRIIEETQPRVAIAENVKNLTGKKFAEQFGLVLESLEQAGYNNYWKVLNAKDFGIPQNRERVFIVSIRKDIDNGTFRFPEGFPLELRLKDVMEDDVDENFYLSDEYMSRFMQSTYSEKFPCGSEYTVLGTTKAETDRMGTNSRHWVYDTNGCMSTLDATMYKQPKQILVCDEVMVKKVGTLNSSQDGVVVSSDGIAPCHTAGHGNTPKVLVSEPAVKQIGNLFPSKTRDNPNQGRLYDAEGISPTLGCMGGSNRQPFVVEKVGNIYPSGGENGNIYLDTGLSPTLKAGTGVKGNGIGSCNAPKVLLTGNE